MAAHVKKPAGKTSMADYLATLQKDYGEDIGSFGGQLVNSDRIPTGLFPLDLAMGGGFPVRRASVVYGPESSSKTNIVLKAIANFQRIYPEKVNVFFDVENAFDPAWAARLGVITEKLVVIRPSYGEQIVDMAESALYTDDCGIVAIDSLAAILTTREFNNSAEVQNVGGNTLLLGALCRKTTLALMEAEKKGRMSTLLYINQIRSKVGVVMGNPETMPGGNAPKFQASMILRVHGKNVMDAKISKTMPVRKEVTFRITKWKAPILCAEGKVEMVMLPHGGFKPGEADDFNTVSEYLKAMGLFVKGEKGKGWIICGDAYPVIADFEKRLYGDAGFGMAIRNEIIGEMLTKGELIADDEGKAEDSA